MSGAATDGPTRLVAAVTGAAGDVGTAVVHRLAEAGATVVALDRSDDLPPAAAAGVVVDLCAPGTCREAMRSIKETRGRLDILVNCIGVMLPDDRAAEIGRDTWNRTLATNLTAIWETCTAALEVIERPGGAIVNVASLVALRGSAISQAAYTASKGGVVALTRELAIVHAADGVRLNSVCPGPLNCGLAAPLLSDPSAVEDRLAHIPMGRLGRADDVANACLFLSSPSSRYITGVALPVDGGASASFIASNRHT